MDGMHAPAGQGGRYIGFGTTVEDVKPRGLPETLFARRRQSHHHLADADNFVHATIYKRAGSIK